MVDKITEAIDCKKYSAGIFIDLSKAFDTLDHQILLNKLQFYGIRGITLSWFKSYLDSRMQYVEYNGSKSPHLRITCGVPQGSILGPILFLLYINDLCNAVEILHLILFADDTNAFVSHNEVSELNFIINTELNNLNKWFTANKLSVNIKKSCFMLFTGKRKIDSNSFKILLNGTELTRVESTKFLGIVIDEKLSWSQHIDLVINKIAKSAGLIGKLKHTLPRHALITLHNSLILPYINYCTMIWAANSLFRLKRIVVIQNRVIRIISGTDRFAHAPPLLKKYSILTVDDIYTLQVAQFMYKSINHLLPVIFDQYFTPNATVHLHYTRHSKDLHLFSVATKLRQSSIRFAGTKIWNSLTEELISAVTLTSFTKNLKRTLLDKYT